MKSEEYTDWLNTLKDGDEYETYYTNYWGAELRTVKITKRTAKCIFIGETRYLLSKDCLPLPATDKQVAEVKLKRAINKIDSLINDNKNKITQEQSDAILSVLSIFDT